MQRRNGRPYLRWLQHKLIHWCALRHTHKVYVYVFIVLECAVIEL